jgi:hypothetical protein
MSSNWTETRVKPSQSNGYFGPTPRICCAQHMCNMNTLSFIRRIKS